MTSGKKELFDLKRRNPSKKTNKEGAFEWGPVPLMMRWVAGDLERTRHKGLGVSPIHTLEGSVILSPNCTTPVRYHDKMTIIIILESDSTTITDSIAITDSISIADSVTITDIILLPIVLLSLIV